MKFIVLTIFPDMFTPFWENGIVRRAIENGHIATEAVDLRLFTRDRHRTTDDRPYGGGPGMVMKPEPLAAAVRSVKERIPSARTVLMSPQGRPFHQHVARRLSREAGLIFVCGRYEGLDERFCRNYIDEEISIGDFVLTGGELPAMMIMDAVTRLIPGTLGGEGAAEMDSFAEGLLEHAHYTRPPEFEGETVPPVLLSGNHQAIEQWRLETSLIRTFLKRPDLLENRALNREEIRILKKWCDEIERIIRSQPAPGADPLSGRQ